MLRDKNNVIQVFEHREVLSALLSGQLSHTLIVGPQSVGKRSMLEKLIEHHRLTDVVRILNNSDLDMAAVRRASLESNSGERVILMRLDYLKRTEEEKLLKIIEDAPEGVTFLATKTNPTQASPLLSRFTFYSVDYLPNRTVGRILHRLGYAPDRAATLADYSLGAIKPTIDLGKSSAYVSLVNRALTCISEKDADALDKLYSKWEDGHTKAIREWARERVTGRWRMFQESDFPELGKGVAIRIWKRVNLFERPRYVVRSTLAGIIAEERK